MKKLFTGIFIVGCLLSSAQRANAQNFDEVLEGGVADANTYLKNYMQPVATSVGNGLANGWYNTAKPHKTLGFDLTVSTNFALIPDEAKTFEFIQSQYDMSLANPNDNFLPTFAGGETTQQLNIDAATIDAPNGVLGTVDLPVSAIPMPTIQLGIGIIKNTDVIIRYTPELTYDDFSFQSFGFGVKHDIKQWIPGMKLLPFDLSGLVGFNRVTTTYTIDAAAEQFAEFNASATTVQAIISKKLLFFTPYAGLGFNIVNSDFSLNGDYLIEEGGQSTTLSDPIAIEFDGSGGPRFTVGARVKILWVLALNVDYTFQNYNNLTVGLGLNIR